MATAKQHWEVLCLTLALEHAVTVQSVYKHYAVYKQINRFQ